MLSRFFVPQKVKFQRKKKFFINEYKIWQNNDKSIGKNSNIYFFLFCFLSTNQKVHIQKEKRKLFTIFQYLLGEYDKDALTQLNLLINNQQEALGFIDSEFHELSVQYLSDHLIQLKLIKQATYQSQYLIK